MVLIESETRAVISFSEKNRSRCSGNRVTFHWYLFSGPPRVSVPRSRSKNRLNESVGAHHTAEKTLLRKQGAAFIARLTLVRKYWGGGGTPNHLLGSCGNRTRGPWVPSESIIRYAVASEKMEPGAYMPATSYESTHVWYSRYMGLVQKDEVSFRT